MKFTLVPNKSLTVVTSDNQVKTARSTHLNWDRIMQALQMDNESELIRQMDATTPIREFAGGTEKTHISIKDGGVYYRDTERLHGRDVDVLLEFISQKIPGAGLLGFLENKMRNPSFRSIESLYPFMEHGNMPLTPNGTFLAYKGVNSDFSSKNTGSEPLISGTRLLNGSIDNSVGEVIRMDRRYVCDDFNQSCGPGLHAGSMKYAIGWAGYNEGSGKVIIVEIDPADVVSVPSSETEKLRACAYKVVGEYTGPLPENYCDDYSTKVDDGDSYEDESEDDDYAAGEVPEEYEVGFENGRAQGRSDSVNGFAYIEQGAWKHATNSYNMGYKAGYEIGFKTLFDDPESNSNINPEVSSYQPGFNEGLKDGRSHKRKQYQKDAFPNSYVTGYANGYSVGRNGK
jgi:hypothetical protein